MIDLGMVSAVAAVAGAPSDSVPAPSEGFGDLFAAVLAASLGASPSAAAADDAGQPASGVTVVAEAVPTPVGAPAQGSPQPAVIAPELGDQAEAALGGAVIADDATLTEVATPPASTVVAEPGRHGGDVAAQIAAAPVLRRSEGNPAPGFARGAERAAARAVDRAAAASVVSVEPTPSLQTLASAGSAPQTPAGADPAGPAADVPARPTVPAGGPAPVATAAARARVPQPGTGMPADPAAGRVDGAETTAADDLAAPLPVQPAVVTPAVRASGANPVAGESAGIAPEAATTPVEGARAGVAEGVFTAAALRRVMEAVEAAEHRPPPNTMAVDVALDGPGEETLRLLVSVRGDTVHVRAPGRQDLAAEWAEPLAEALAERGLSLGDRDARRDADGRPGQPRPDIELPTAPAPSLRPATTRHDGALRL